jgi:hypothetical protein
MKAAPLSWEQHSPPAAVLGDEVGVRGGFFDAHPVNLGTPGHFLVWFRNQS